MQRKLSWTLLFVLLLVFGLGFGLTRDGQQIAVADPLFESGPFLALDDDEEDEERAEEEEEGEEEDYDDDEEYEEDEDKLEEHERHLERIERELHLERIEAESHVVRLELVKHIAEVASNEAATAAFAIMHFEELFDEREDGIAFLNDVIEQTEDGGARRIMRVKLAELYMESDQREQARAELKKLLSNK